MNKLSVGIGLAALTLNLALNFVSGQPAEARRMFASGANGGVGGFARSGQYGSVAGGGAFRRGQSAAGFAGANLAGPNGGTFQGGTAGAFKKGVGGFRKSAFQSTGPNGGSASGYMNSKYNAQTGQGTRNSGFSGQTASGQNYGYTGDTNYTKGQGGQTTIDTQNKGDYTVDWQKGQKPVVTETSQ